MHWASKGVAWINTDTKHLTGYGHYGSDPSPHHALGGWYLERKKVVEKPTKVWYLNTWICGRCVFYYHCFLLLLIITLLLLFISCCKMMFPLVNPPFGKSTRIIYVFFCVRTPCMGNVMISQEFFGYPLFGDSHTILATQQQKNRWKGCGPGKLWGEDHQKNKHHGNMLLNFFWGNCIYIYV
jgi:hypothetical protein